MNVQTIDLYYKAASSGIVEHKSLTFSIDPKNTAVITRECLYLIQQCMLKKVLFILKVNKQTVMSNDPKGEVDLKTAILV